MNSRLTLSPRHPLKMTLFSTLSVKNCALRSQIDGSAALRSTDLRTEIDGSTDGKCVHACMHIYIYVVELKLVQDLPFYKLKTGPSYKLKIGPSFFCCFPQFYSVLGIFRNTNSVAVCQNSVFAKFWVIKNEVFEKKIAFFLCWRNRKRKKRNGKDHKTLSK